MFESTKQLRIRIARLEEIARQQHATIEALCAHTGVTPPPRPDLGPTLNEKERGMIAEGRPIAAIKHVRERTGVGLLEAKELVDRG